MTNLIFLNVHDNPPVQHDTDRVAPRDRVTEAHKKKRPANGGPSARATTLTQQMPPRFCAQHVAGAVPQPLGSAVVARVFVSLIV
jgi:hypothetical protein